ncbi:MAG: hypothetical protein AAF902_00290 [Chloroflexota bacterium]
MSGTASDVVKCDGATIGNATSCTSDSLLFDGSAAPGFENERIDAMHLTLTDSP